MAARGHRVDFLDARGNAQVQIGDNYYGPDPDSEKRLRILTWLNPPPSGAPRSSRREPGTNLWFLDTDFFQAWHSGNDRFVLLHGIVGCGKTTLLSSIAKKCVELQEPGDLVTAFYFSSTVNEALDLNAFLRFLSAQLCEPGAIPSPLKTLYDSHNRSYPPTSPSDDDLRELVRAQICEPRSRLYDQEPLAGTSMSKVFLLVDGLDEIRDRGVRRDVTGFLNELCSLDTQKLRILATSRPEADILMSLRLERGWSARAIPKDRVRADIEIYVKHELTRHPELEDLDDSVRAELLSRLAGPKQVMYARLLL